MFFTISYVESLQIAICMNFMQIAICKSTTIFKHYLLLWCDAGQPATPQPHNTLHTKPPHKDNDPPSAAA